MKNIKQVKIFFALLLVASLISMLLSLTVKMAVITFISLIVIVIMWALAAEIESELNDE